MAYNPGPPQNMPPYPQYPSQPNPQYPSQPNPQYPAQPNPQYPSQPNPQYPPQPASQYPPQAAPPVPGPAAPSAPPQIDGYRDIGFEGDATGAVRQDIWRGAVLSSVAAIRTLFKNRMKRKRRRWRTCPTTHLSTWSSAQSQLPVIVAAGSGPSLLGRNWSEVHALGAPPLERRKGFVAPPAASAPTQPPANQPPIAVTQEPLTRDEVNDALAAFVAQHCCYGSGPIKDIQIRNVAPTFTFKYTLESFVEKRETKWKMEPFSGSDLSAGVGPAPGPWEIPVTPDAQFKDQKRVMQVPHTQSLRPCHDCQAHGDVRCKHCAGRGQDRCGICGGSGQRMGDRCIRCNGVGSNKCTWCGGNGMVTCATCRGKRNLKYYVELTVTWKVHSDRYVVETPTGLPDSELTAVTGETVCQAGGVVVWPLAGFPDSRVSTASEHLVRKHKTGWPMGRILQQRHDVQQIPIHSISYNYGGKDGTFFVCGHEKNVHFPDYPSQCCGCCAVM